ncbi:MAG: DNA polymerase IV [Gemmatimonadetes bacterium]|nr:DNA polymerase IV [Gemmatimonadota bacterium]
MTTVHPPRRILLADCDQFFVQCARLADPDGAGREPLLLVGGSASHRGVVTSASYETRAFGVRSGMPTARALRLCPRAVVVPVPRTLCLEKSHEVRRGLEQFSPVVESASIDEAYIDMSGTEALYRNEPLSHTASRMQAAVLAATSITVSIGGGSSRVIAKLAAGRAKPAGIRIVPAGEEIAFMRGLRLSAIPGVGPVFADQLERRGLTTVEHVLDLDLTSLEHMIGASRGGWLYRRACGIDGGEVVPDRDARSMSREETFATDIQDSEALETELLALTVRLGADLRGHGLRTRTIAVKLRDHDFRTRRASRTIEPAIDSDRALFAIARELLHRLRSDRRVPARLVGVAVSGLRGPEHATQLPLLEDGATLETDRDRRLARATDAARSRFGHRAVRSGRLIDR